MVLPIPEAETLAYINKNIEKSTPFNCELISSIIKYFGIQIREINRFMSKLNSVYDAAKVERWLKHSDNLYQSIMIYIFPIMLAAKFTDEKKYQQLKDKKEKKLSEAF